jgi:C4-dicarboxylate transporter DctM subunit
MSVIPLFLVLFVTLGIGVPIGIAMGLSAFVYIFFNGLPLSQIPQMYYGAADIMVLIAIPMFLLAGILMERGGITRRLVNFSHEIVGRLPGALGAVTVVTCAIFAALSGSGPATTAAVGGLMVPEMKRNGYPGNYAGAIVASAGGIGIVIPPSVPLIMYAIMSQQSVTRLFLAGFLPGIFLALCLLVFNTYYCKKKGYGVAKEVQAFSVKGLLRQTWKSGWSLLAPIVILGGIYSGMTTVTEASAIAVFYSLFVGIFIYKELKLKIIWEAAVRALRITGVSFMLLGAGRILARQFVIANAPEAVTGSILGLTNDRTLVLLLVIVLLVFIGMWMETIAQIIILTPVFLPLMQAIGVDPIHFGIIFIVGCEIGFLTPPLGANLFIAKELGETTYEELAGLAYLIAVVEIAALIVIALMPEMSLFLPRLIMGS